MYDGVTWWSGTNYRSTGRPCCKSLCLDIIIIVVVIIIIIVTATVGVVTLDSSHARTGECLRLCFSQCHTRISRDLDMTNNPRRHNTIRLFVSLSVLPWVVNKDEHNTRRTI